MDNEKSELRAESAKTIDGLREKANEADQKLAQQEKRTDEAEQKLAEEEKRADEAEQKLAQQEKRTDEAEQKLAEEEKFIQDTIVRLTAEKSELHVRYTDVFNAFRKEKERADEAERRLAEEKKTREAIGRLLLSRDEHYSRRFEFGIDLWIAAAKMQPSGCNKKHIFNLAE
jgi:16S rRNA G1207 methylase RsmC